MRLMRWGAVLSCAALALAAGLLCAPPREGTAFEGALADGAQAVQEAQSGTRPLFEGLDAQAISSVTVEADGREFRFATDAQGVSVNGRMADAEIFSTLLAQIVALPVAERAPYQPEGELMLTLTVACGEGELCARFYREDEDRPYADVVCAQDGGVRYGVTKAWRVGKLVLTCDGTRIQDESGRETPADAAP